MENEQRRPTFRDIAAQEALDQKQRQQEAKERAEAKELDIKRRRASFAIIRFALPLLDQYVDKSPVEIPHPTGFFKQKTTKKIVGGWPLGSRFVSWGDSSYNIAGSRTEDFLLLEDGRFEYGELNMSRPLFVISTEPKKLTEDNIINLPADCSATISKPYLLSGKISSLLSEAGQKFTPPNVDIP